MTNEDLEKYLDGLQEGEEVVETSKNALYGCKGKVYISKKEGQSFGSKCVKWDFGDGTFMGTSVTYGTRRLSDVEKE